MPRSEEQFQEIREKSKRHIMDTALKLFSTQGYHATSIQRIAKEAGIATGLVYNYFESKEQLLDEIVANAFAEIGALVFAGAGVEIATGDLAGLIGKLFEIVKAKRGSWQLYLTTMLQPEVAAIGMKNVNHLNTALSQMGAAHFQKEGSDDAASRGKALAAIVHGAILGFIFEQDEATFDLVRDVIISDLLHKS